MLLISLKIGKEKSSIHFIPINRKRTSNKPIESINGWIKILLKITLKYKNFERLKNRIMY